MKQLSLQNVLGEFVPSGFDFRRIEMLDEDGSPIALVWYGSTPSSDKEWGARIDLQKQVFLDDFVGDVDRLQLRDCARKIVQFIYQQGSPRSFAALK